MDTEARKLAERAILENIENEVECKKILTDAFTAGLFTNDEVEVIVKDVKAWNDKRAERDKVATPEQLKMSRALLKELGAYPALALITLIKQFPHRAIGEGWMIPDEKATIKALQIQPFQYHSILNNLKEKSFLEKKLNKDLKKITIKLNFFRIQKAFEDYEDDEPHGDSLEV